MKRSLLLFAFTIAILTISTAFVLMETPRSNIEVSDESSNYITATTFGLNLNKSGELKIMDTNKFKITLENILANNGDDYTIKNIIEKDALIEGNISMTTFTVQFLNETEDYMAKVSYSTAFAGGACISINCASGCKYSSNGSGSFSCSNCIDGIWPWSPKGSCTKKTITVF